MHSLWLKYWRKLVTINYHWPNRKEGADLHKAQVPRRESRCYGRFLFRNKIFSYEQDQTCKSQRKKEIGKVLALPRNRTWWNSEHAIWHKSILDIFWNSAVGNWLCSQPYLCQLLSHVWLVATPWTLACQASLSIEFSRQEYWSWLPFPFPGDLPDPGIEPRFPALQADSLPFEPLGKPIVNLAMTKSMHCSPSFIPPPNPTTHFLEHWLGWPTCPTLLGLSGF